MRSRHKPLKSKKMKNSAGNAADTKHDTGEKAGSNNIKSSQSVQTGNDGNNGGENGHAEKKERICGWELGICVFGILALYAIDCICPPSTGKERTRVCNDDIISVIRDPLRFWWWGELCRGGEICSDVKRHLKEELDKLDHADKFPHQSPRLWKEVKSLSVQHHCSPAPEKPLVFMIVAYNDTANTSVSLAEELGKILGYPNKPVVHVHGESVARMDSTEGASAVNKNLTDFFKEHRFGAAVIDHVELLRAVQAFLFHKFCESTVNSAVYPDATFIFVAHLQRRVEWNRAAQEVVDFLTDKWSDSTFEDDTIPGLLSRMGDCVLTPTAIQPPV